MYFTKPHAEVSKVIGSLPNRKSHQVITAVWELNTHRVKCADMVHYPSGPAFAVNKELTSNYRFSTSLVRFKILETERRKEQKWDSEGGNQREKESCTLC